MIFALALNHQRILIFAPITYCAERPLLGLLYVCRQIHAETALLPYALNLFWVYDTILPKTKVRVTWNCCILHAFLTRRTPAQIRAMTKVINAYAVCGAQKSATEWMSTEHGASEEE